MIFGSHVILFSSDSDADRAFLADVLGFDHVDAGGGWLIFGLPPAELALHPAETEGAELYFMCDDLEAEMRTLAEKGVPVFRGRRGSLGIGDQDSTSRRRLRRAVPTQASGHGGAARLGLVVPTPRRKRVNVYR